MIKTIAIVAAVVIAVPLVLAAFKPDTFSVKRSAVIMASPQQLHALIKSRAEKA